MTLVQWSMRFFLTFLFCTGYAQLIPVKQAMDQLVLQQMKAQQIPGLALAILIDGEPFYLQRYGFAQLEPKKAFNLETLFGIASCSKVMTAFGVMLLVDEGRIHIEDSIKKYLPEVPESWRAVTVQQLLSHTSGIPQNQGNYLPWIKTWNQMAKQPFEFIPGTKTKYNNFGFIVLCRLIEVVSHQPYERFMRQRIFNPLGMHQTQIPSQLMPPEIAMGYTITHQEVKPSANQRHWIEMWGSGGIVSTIIDLAKWDQALTHQKILSPQAYTLMWTPVNLLNGKPSGWCLGWGISEKKGQWTATKDGAITGYRSLIVRHLTDQITCIVLANVTPAQLGKIAQPIYQLLLKEKRKQKKNK
jgi:CubicO group peptidase (beta-lactamase class C family)